MRQGKYIIGLAMDDINNRRLEAILFSTTMTHKTAGEFFGFGEHVVSAGFFRLGYKSGQELTDDGSVQVAPKITVEVFGESESLGIKGQDFDAMYVARALGLVPEDHLSKQERIEGYRLGCLILDERMAKEKSASTRSVGAPYRAQRTADDDRR